MSSFLSIVKVDQNYYWHPDYYNSDKALNDYYKVLECYITLDREDYYWDYFTLVTPAEHHYEKFFSFKKKQSFHTLKLMDSLTITKMIKEFIQ